MGTNAFGQVLIGLSALALTPAFLPAQDYRGRIQGTVFEASKSVIAGAAVRLTNTDTTISSTRQSAANGSFLFDLVVPGTYLLNVESAGFSKFKEPGIVIGTLADVTFTSVPSL